MLTSAIHILVLGGLANVVLSFALGWLLSLKRMNGPMEPHKWLLIAHEVSLQEGMLLLGLAYALSFAQLPESWAIAAAWMLVAGAFFQDFSGILNWLTRTNDQFKEKSIGWISATINAILNTLGLGIVVYGVVMGLCA